MHTKKRIVILGAGISGLALGWYLKKRFPTDIDVKICEGNDRPGGWIQSIRQDGFLFELGPRSCRPYGNGLETLGLIEELGLQEELMFASKAARRRFLYVDQNLKSLPANPLEFITSPFAISILKALWNDWKTPKSSGEEESIAEFAYRRLGKGPADLFFDPLVSGIYGGGFHDLSMQSCFPQLVEWEQRHGWLLGGAFAKRTSKPIATTFVLNAQKKGLFSLKNGMESLVKALAEQLKAELKLGAKATKLSFIDGNCNVLLENGCFLPADYLCFAIPSQPILSLIEPHLNEIGGALQGIPAASIGIICLGYRQQLLRQKGFGHLIPSSEKEKVLGIVWDSSVFPEQNHSLNETRLTVMVGEAYLTNERELIHIALEAVKKQLGISASPDTVYVKIAKHAIPQYLKGHATRLKMIEGGLQQLPVPVTLVSNGFHGISVNDCVANAKRAAHNMRI